VFLLSREKAPYGHDTTGDDRNQSDRLPKPNKFTGVFTVCLAEKGSHKEVVYSEVDEEKHDKPFQHEMFLLEKYCVYEHDKDNGDINNESDKED
jgi:hypothetical protein